jgi:hypothetical protein
MRCIPEEYQSNTKLLEYFKGLYPSESVLESNIAVNLPNLSKKILERDTMLANLEHAINVKNVKGIPPMHSTKMCGGEKVDSIAAYSEELRKLNTEVKESIEKLEPTDCRTTSKMDDGEAQQDEEIKATADYNVDEEIQGTEESKERKSLMSSIMSGKDDGDKLTAAFVTFNSLRTTQKALQMFHYEEPHAMETLEAPDPEGKNILQAGGNGLTGRRF